MPSLTPRINRSSRPGLGLNRTTKLILGGIALLVVVFTVVPRWRRATFCTLGGGKWTAGTDGVVAVECRKKSKTAGAACTGQLRDECDRSQCDLEVKPASGASGGTCPDTYVPYFYAKTGGFYRK